MTGSEDGGSAAPEVVVASVRAGGVETTYRRSGRGRAVLMIVAEGPPVGWTDGLFAALSRRYRVLWPRVPAGEEALTRWLSGVLEGLGGPAPLVVTDRRTAVRLVEFRSTRGDRVSGWLVLRAGEVPLLETGELGTGRRIGTAAR